MADFLTEWDAYCAEHGTPDRLELMLCDVNAVLRGKWLPGEEVSKLVDGKVRLPLSTYVPSIFGFEVEETGFGIVVGDPDGVLVPVPETLRPVPWGQGSVAQVLVEMTDESGSLSTLSTREVLARAVARLNRMGLFPVVATELEFYLVQTRSDPMEAPQPPERLPEAQNYDLEVLNKSEEVLNAILEAAATQGLPTDTLIAEYGPGQFEINFHHSADPLAAADTALLFRRIVRSVVTGFGLDATFMAKPYADAPGSGMHMHVSLLNAAGENIFTAAEADLVSDTLRHAVGGVLKTMPEFQAVFAPHMNSYRRFQVNSFAPTAPVWGFDNRAAAVRLPETHGPGARLEHRISGADVNPYLALAAVLVGIADGLENKIDPGKPLDGGTTEQAENLAHDWTLAVDRFAGSDNAATLLGETLRDVYVTLRQTEIERLVTPITPQEYATYLSRM